jgi:hypothetical protein
MGEYDYMDQDALIAAAANNSPRIDSPRIDSYTTTRIIQDERKKTAERTAAQHKKNEETTCIETINSNACIGVKNQLYKNYYNDMYDIIKKQVKKELEQEHKKQQSLTSKINNLFNIRQASN